MRTTTWIAGFAAAATLFAAMGTAGSAMADETGTEPAGDCAATSNTITLKGSDMDAFKTWGGKQSTGTRTFSAAKVADYEIGNGPTGGSVHLQTVEASKTAIINALGDIKDNSGNKLYDSEDNQGDPMNWLANTRNDTFIRNYANDPGVTGTPLSSVKLDETNKTVTLDVSEPGLYVIFDTTNPKKQIKDTGDTTVEYDGFANMLVGTPLPDSCGVTNNSGTIDLTQAVNAKTGSSTTVRGGFTFTKVGVKDDRTGLGGAEFTLYSDKGFNTPVKDGNDKPVVATSNSGGLVDFSQFKLNAGTYYLKETKVPATYWAGSAGKLKITMIKNDNGQIALGSIEDMSLPSSGLLTNGTNGYVYHNVKSIVQLPLTGAMGMALLGIVALLCAGGAAIIVIRARKTKRELAA